MWYSSYWRHVPRSWIGDLSLRETHVEYVEKTRLCPGRFQVDECFCLEEMDLRWKICEVYDIYGLDAGGVDVCVHGCIVYLCMYIYRYVCVGLDQIRCCLTCKFKILFFPSHLGWYPTKGGHPRDPGMFVLSFSCSSHQGRKWQIALEIFQEMDSWQVSMTGMGQPTVTHWDLKGCRVHLRIMKDQCKKDLRIELGLAIHRFMMSLFLPSVFLYVYMSLSLCICMLWSKYMYTYVHHIDFLSNTVSVYLCFSSHRSFDDWFPGSPVRWHPIQ